MKILFWLLAACDVAVLLVFFVLGLAFAPSSRTSSFAVAAYMLVVPTLVLLLAIFLFVRGTSPLSRGAGLLLVAAPALLLFLSKSIANTKLKLNSDSQGNVAYFHDGPLREMKEAIDRNDVAAVKRLAPLVDINTTGYAGMTFLAYALQHLKQSPDSVEVLAALLAAGADPNRASAELPLAIAMQNSRQTGHRPVQMLLAARANPNVKDQFGTPLFFYGTGAGVDSSVMRDLLEHGADIKTTDRDGRTLLFSAANSANWRAALVLLEKGANPKVGKVSKRNGLHGGGRIVQSCVRRLERCGGGYCVSQGALARTFSNEFRRGGNG